MPVKVRFSDVGFPENRARNSDCNCKNKYFASIIRSFIVQQSFTDVQIHQSVNKKDRVYKQNLVELHEPKYNIISASAGSGSPDMHSDYQIGGTVAKFV